MFLTALQVWAHLEQMALMGDGRDPQPPRASPTLNIQQQQKQPRPPANGGAVRGVCIDQGNVTAVLPPTPFPSYECHLHFLHLCVSVYVCTHHMYAVCIGLIHLSHQKNKKPARTLLAASWVRRG